MKLRSRPGERAIEMQTRPDCYKQSDLKSSQAMYMCVGEGGYKKKAGCGHSNPTLGRLT